MTLECLKDSFSTCTEVSGVENIGQCCRLSQLSWLLGARTYLLTYLLVAVFGASCLS